MTLDRNRPVGRLTPDIAVPLWKRWMVDSRIAAANASVRLPSARLRLHLARSLLGWSVGTDVVIGRYCTVIGLGGVTIGNTVNVGRHAHLDGRGDLTIGSNDDIAQHVSVHTADHDPDDPFHTGRVRETVIGNRVWLASGSTVMQGARLDDGVVLGAQSVAHGHLEADGIYAGNPARLIRQRNPGAQSALKPYRRFWQ